MSKTTFHFILVCQHPPSTATATTKPTTSQSNGLLSSSTSLVSVTTEPTSPSTAPLHIYTAIPYVSTTNAVASTWLVQNQSQVFKQTHEIYRVWQRVREPTTETLGASMSATSKSAQVRALNALTACFVADAACMGTHWIYKEDDLTSVLGDHAATPEFHEPPSCPFYNSTDNKGHYHSGDMSPYGEEAHALLGYMATEQVRVWSGVLATRY
jgi:hypothetical protein